MPFVIIFILFFFKSSEVYISSDVATYQKTKSNGACVQIFYDFRADYKDNLGKSFAIMIYNLLGHFKNYDRTIYPVEDYKEGQLESCSVNFYVGAIKNLPLPTAFIKDYLVTQKIFVWLAHNFWQVPNFLKEFGYSEYKSVQLFKTEDKEDFFQHVKYKNEIFSKYNNHANNSFIGAADLIKLAGKPKKNCSVLAEIYNSDYKLKADWAIQCINKFYFAEIPLTFIHESDRYFVFADLLFDILKEKALLNFKPAVLRLEDIHPAVDVNLLKRAVEILNKHGVKPHLSIIPYFKDPLDQNKFKLGDRRLNLSSSEIFLNLMREYQNKNYVFIWHGVTHQYQNKKNPFSATTAEDFEFWNEIEDKPIDEDSTDYVLNKLQDGFESLNMANINPKIWLSPHYKASALDNIIFGKLFKAVIGRSFYMDIKPINLTDNLQLPTAFELKDKSRSKNRSYLFKNLNLQYAGQANNFYQTYSYEIFSDYYQQYVLPENLGNVQPFLNQQVKNVRNVETILADAKRNLVLRDVWASVFYHPYLLSRQYSLNESDLEKLIIGLKKLGYQFVDLNEHVSKQNTTTQ